MKFAEAVHNVRTAEYWAERTKGFDFSAEDKLDALAYNKVLWEGLMEGTSYPVNGGRPVDAASVSPAVAHEHTAPDAD